MTPVFLDTDTDVVPKLGVSTRPFTGVSAQR